MTFTVPEELARQLLKRVAARDRSRYVAEAIAAQLHRREEQLIRACEVANRDSDAMAIEQEWDALSDDITEPWSDAPAR